MSSDFVSKSVVPADRLCGEQPPREVPSRAAGSPDGHATGRALDEDTERPPASIRSGGLFACWSYPRADKLRPLTYRVKASRSAFLAIS